MQNEERILQILTEMQRDVSGLKQDMTEVKQDIAALSAHIDTQVLRLDMKIENEVVMAMRSLFDGHMLNKEKHDILESRVEAVELRVDKLEIAAS